MTVMYVTKKKTKRFIESNGNKLEVPEGKTIAKFKNICGYIDGYVEYEHEFYAMFISPLTLKIRVIDVEFITVISEPNEVT